MSKPYYTSRQCTPLFDRNKLDDSRVESLTLRRRLRSFLCEDLSGWICTLTEVNLSLTWCVLYVWDTYTPIRHISWAEYVDWALVSVFLLFFFLHLFVAESRLRFLYSGYAIVDYLTIVPIIFSSSQTAFVRIMSVLRIFRLISILFVSSSLLLRRIFKLSFTIIAFLFISTAMVLIVEPDTFINFHTAFYFIVAAIFTVGFGDLVPITQLGRGLVAVIIIAAVILIPLEGYFLSRIVTMRFPSYLGIYTPPADSKHLVIFVNTIEIASLIQILSELFIKFRLQRQVDMHVVIMTNTVPTPNQLHFIDSNNDKHEPWAHILKGTPLEFMDLNRAAAHRADAIILVYDDDNDTCLMTMSINAYCRTVPIYSLVARPETLLLMSACVPVKTDSASTDFMLLARFELESALLARSTTTRGFSTLISNLVRSIQSTHSPLEHEHLEYSQGTRYEIYFGMLPLTLIGIKFLDVVIYIFSLYSSLLIGLINPDTKEAVLNPGEDYCLHGHELGIFIAKDASISTQVKDIFIFDPKVDDAVITSICQNSSVNLDIPDLSITPSSKKLDQDQELIDYENDESSENYSQDFSDHSPSHVDDINAPESSSSATESDHQTTEHSQSTEEKGPEAVFVPPEHSFRESRRQIDWYQELRPTRLIRYHLAVRNSNLLKEYYRVLDSPRTYRSALLERAPDGPHIIVSGMMKNWQYLIAPMRSRSVPNCDPIVIVTPIPLLKEQWLVISHFPDIFLIPCASLLKRRHLDRLNIMTATHVILVGNQDRGNGTSTPPYSMSFNGEEAPFNEMFMENPSYTKSINRTNNQGLPDNDTRDIILIFSFIRTYYPNVNILFWIADESMLRFLHKAQHRTEPYLLQEVRNGTACSTSMTVDRILAHTVFNPLVLDVFLDLILGIRVTSSGKEKKLSPPIQLEPIPQECIGMTFSRLCKIMVKQRAVIPIGLYRSLVRGEKKRHDDYVYTCPSKETVIYPSDKVYLLLPKTAT